MIWYDEIWYDMIRYGTIWYDMMWYDKIWYDKIWYDKIWWDMIRYDEIWWDMMRYDEIWLFFTLHIISIVIIGFMFFVMQHLDISRFSCCIVNFFKILY